MAHRNIGDLSTDRKGIISEIIISGHSQDHEKHALRPVRRGTTRISWISFERFFILLLSVAALFSVYVSISGLNRLLQGHLERSITSLKEAQHEFHGTNDLHQPKNKSRRPRKKT